MFQYKFYWEHTQDGGARLLRAFGTAPEAVIPKRIGGVPITEIGAYCFAEDGHLPSCYQVSGEDGGLHELSGSYLKRVILPEGVKKAGNFAFYNCTALTQLEIGSSLTQIGSDAFMNCRNLHRICVWCEAKAKSGLHRILGQISSDMEVLFCSEHGICAAVLFPEYYESYDEIAPAHLFGRNIEGEGFRARQCFRDGVFDFAQYDTIFKKACAEESERTLCRLALDRLRYSVELTGQASMWYESYVREHVHAVCSAAVRERSTDVVLFLCERGLIGRSGLEACVGMSAETEWVEGTAVFLRFIQEFFPQTAQEDRYAFDEF